MQGDEQEPDMRCGTLGTSGHVTAKSSIRNWGVLYKSGVTCLTLGGLPCALERRVRGELAEVGAILPDRMGEVSRRHSRRGRPAAGTGNEPWGPGRTHPTEGLNGFQEELNDRQANRPTIKH